MTCASLTFDENSCALVSLVIENRIECLLEKMDSIGFRILSAFLFDVEKEEENVSMSLNADVFGLWPVLVFVLKMHFRKLSKNSKS